MKSIKTIVTGVEMNSAYPKNVGLLLRGVSKEQMKEMLDKHEAVVIRNTRTNRVYKKCSFCGK